MRPEEDSSTAATWLVTSIVWKPRSSICSGVYFSVIE